MSYLRPRRRRSRLAGTARLLSLAALLLILLTAGVAAFRFLPDLLPDPDPTLPPGQTPTLRPEDPTPTPEPTPEPTPTPGPRPGQNPLLFPRMADLLLPMGIPDPEALPSAWGHSYDIIGPTGFVDTFLRKDPFSFGDPLDYTDIPGVLTFRGNPFRNLAAYGYTSILENTLVQRWERPVGSLASSSWSFSWSGTGWTGQPVMIQWPAETRARMNLDPAKKEKDGLVEVIYPTMDGKIYFFDLEDGVETRPPIRLGVTVKGTAAIDPRGYPLLYVGQGDFPPKGSSERKIGFRIFSLLDQSLLHFQNGIDSSAHRQEWGAFDSSPLVDAATDTLLWCGENGLVYTMKLNTEYDPAAGTLSIDPETVRYRYKMTGLTGQGIESSPSVYGGYAFFSDNSGFMNCVDLDRMEPVWARRLFDDSDVTPVLDVVDGAVSLYTGTEVDWQKDTIGTYKGDAVVYRLDALTGEILWQNAYPCYTKNAANSGDDVNGGVLGTPVVGKHAISDLVVFSFCMTNNVYSGTRLVAFRKSDGGIAWEYGMDHYSWSSPVDLYDETGKAYLVMADSIGQLHLVDGRTGERLALLQLLKNKGKDNEAQAGNIESSAAVFGNRLVIGTRGGVICGVEIG